VVVRHFVFETCLEETRTVCIPAWLLDHIGASNNQCTYVATTKGS
jgi:hypothetical protein